VEKGKEDGSLNLNPSAIADSILFNLPIASADTSAQRGKSPSDWPEVTNLFEAGMYAARFLRAIALT
jgi:hypothetical protein